MIPVDKTKKVSIIIPMKNNGIYALKLLKSLEKDPYNNLEIIFVDDGSKDNSVDKIKDYVLSENLKNVKLFREDCEGLATAKNVGIEKSTGDYLIFLRPEDEIDPNFITALMLTIGNGEQVLAMTSIKEKLGAEKERVLYGSLTASRKPKETTKYYRERLFKKDNRLHFLNNKLFNAKIIKEHDLKFEKVKEDDKSGKKLDEKSSHEAENLKFIKRYSKVGEIETFITINKPLYIKNVD